jgi:DNA-binding LacI/PurR family transcriptional regulator
LSLGRVPTIALCTDWIDSAYHEEILRGTFDGARDRDANFLCLASGMPGQSTSAAESAVLSMVRPDAVDAVIVGASALVNTGEVARLALYETLKTLPACSLAVEIPGHSCITIDNASGMAALVRHLVRAHDGRRIGFIRGPEGNPEAERRFDVYRATLAEQQLSVEERLVLPGDFTGAAGARAAEILFDERKVSVSHVDAIVAANDAMALAFIDTLDARGIRVPDAVAVVGFDDLAEARYSRAPLTTVRQPLYEQGREAARLARSRTRGATPDHVTMPTELVTRHSCGCVSRMSSTSFAPAAQSGRTKSFELMLIDRRQVVLAELQRAARGKFGMLGSGWETRLLTALSDEVTKRSPDGLRKTVDDMLQRITDAEVDAASFQDVVSALWQQLIPCTFDEPELRTQVERALDEMRLSTAATARRKQGAERIRLREFFHASVVAMGAIATCSSIEQLASAIEQTLPPMGIGQAELALRDPTAKDQLTRVLISSGGKARVDSTAFRTSYFLRQLFRPGGARGLYVSVLHHDSEPLGVIALDLGAPASFVYTALREAFSAAIRAIGRV